MKLSTSGMGQQPQEGGNKCLNSELWHACAGPLVSLPLVGSRVVYFPQGHSEQVAATTNKEIDAHIPNYPNLPPQLICQLHSVTMHVDIETDEVYAQMTLQPLNPQEQKEMYLPVELGTPSNQPTNYFCKTLTASDTSTHGGFSVPRRAAEKVFPPLDFSQTPPAQELIARDLHDVEWKFKHIFRGQPKRHLLTTGWSVFVSAKRLVAGDAVIFIWNEKNQLLLGIRRASRPQNVMPSSVLSSDSMHIGLLAAAAHAAATSSCFTVFYNPRASPSEFVIPFSKYVKAVYHTRVSVGMRFRMLFETEESSVRRYMGTITGIGDLDPERWPNSHWRSVKVGWDESTAGERQPRVSLWEIQPLATFPMYSSLFPLRLKRPWYPGSSSFQDGCNESMNNMARFRGEASPGEHGLFSMNFQSGGTFPWMMSQRLDPTIIRNDLGQHGQQYQSMLTAGLQNFGNEELLRHQLAQLHQSGEYLRLSGSHNPMSSISSHILSPQTQHQVNHDHQLQRQPSDVPSPSFRSDLTITSTQDMMGSLGSQGQGHDLLNFSRTGQTMVNQQSTQQPWTMKFAQLPVSDGSHSASLPPYPGKDSSVEHETCNLDTRNHALFGTNIDSSELLLPTTVSSIDTSLVRPGVSFELLEASGFQGPLFNYPHDSELLQNTGQGQDNQSTRNCTFVKVYKSGSLGRSVDIARFNSYQELLWELGEMFGIEGLIEGPQRSGWQLVFVDREDDVLLLGDDPWEEFMNNVWCIKILSPEDVQKLEKHAVGL